MLLRQTAPRERRRFRAISRLITFSLVVAALLPADHAEAEDLTSSRDLKGVTPTCTLLLATVETPSEILSADTNRPNNSTFVLGERIRLSFDLSGLRPFQTALLCIKVSDEFGDTIASWVQELVTDAAGNAIATSTAPADRLGYYRVDAALSTGTTLAARGTRPAGFFSYAVIQNPDARRDYGSDGSRFGLSGGFTAQQGSIIPYLGVRHVISSIGDWQTLEPNGPGEFEAKRKATQKSRRQDPATSSATDQVTYNGKPWNTYSLTTLTRAGLPVWAYDAPPKGICWAATPLNAAGVKGLPAFAKALATVEAADHPNVDSHFYQVTWEWPPASPNRCKNGASPRQLTQYYELTYSAIHRVDPKAVVVGPTMWPETLTEMRSLLAVGLGNYVDAVSMHTYVNWPPETEGLVKNVRTQMRMVRQAVGHNLPFVSTEHGFTSSNGTSGTGAPGSGSELNQALGDIRETIILLGEGFQFDISFYLADFWVKTAVETANTFGFYWNLNSKLLWNPDKLSPKPVVPAFSAMTYLLDGTTSIGALADLGGTQMGYRFVRGSTTVLALWDYQGKSILSNVAIPPGAKICDWMGNCSKEKSREKAEITVGPAPVYVVYED